MVKVTYLRNSFKQGHLDNFVLLDTNHVRRSLGSRFEQSLGGLDTLQGGLCVRTFFTPAASSTILSLFMIPSLFKLPALVKLPLSLFKFPSPCKLFPSSSFVFKLPSLHQPASFPFQT